MIHLHNVTLICADCVNPGAALAAIKQTLEHITPKRIIFFTDKPILAGKIDTIVLKNPIKSKREYSRFILKDLNKYIETEFVLIIQADGFVIDGEQWDDNFLQYDLLGAPWPYDHDRRIGNGGCSLRSKKLLEAVANDEMIDVLHPEDQSLCIIYKFYLEEKYDIRFAPEELAEKFSYELIEPKAKTFAFHGFHWRPYQETVVIKRTGAMGDVIQVEPVLEYFHRKGYRVVLDTLPEFYELFQNHYFPIHFKPHFNPEITYIEYNLDMSYESNPKRLHLRTYFDFCGVPSDEQVIRNPRLSFPVTDQMKLFKKYVVIHIDDREQQSRNVRGIDWLRLIGLLRSQGYTVIQIGKNTHEDTGALYMNTVNLNLLAYLIAGCDLFIGTDSGPSHIAVATKRPAIIFFGSVKPGYIHADHSNIHPIANIVCEKPFCWHESVGTTGTACYIDNDHPPCNQFETERVLYAIEKLLCKN